MQGPEFQPQYCQKHTCTNNTNNKLEPRRSHGAEEKMMGALTKDSVKQKKYLVNSRMLHLKLEG
jgi:hypothetical protein